MTNINCSENCSYEKNGKCSLSHVSITADIMGYGSNCAYFFPRSEKMHTPPEKNE